MSKLASDDLKAIVIGGKTVAEWDEDWEILENAFNADHPVLREVVGLVRIRLQGQVTYIMRATELKGGIAKALKRIAGPEQTGNSGFGAQQIRKYIDQVVVEILRVEKVTNPSLVTRTLKKAMNKRYDPVWAIPFKRRMNMIRDGIISPDKLMFF